MPKNSPPPPPPPPRQNDFNSSDCIQIEQIKVSGKHGVSSAERDACMPLEVDLLLQVNLKDAEASDDLEDTVNYSTITKLVVSIIESSSHKLLERLAGVVLNDLFSNERIKAARIKISKPGRLDGATPSVTLVRRNPRHAQKHEHREHEHQ